MNSIIDVSDRTDEKVVIRGEEFNRNYPTHCIRWYDAKLKKSMKNLNEVNDIKDHFRW